MEIMVVDINFVNGFERLLLLELDIKKTMMTTTAIMMTAIMFVDDTDDIDGMENDEKNADNEEEEIDTHRHLVYGMDFCQAMFCRQMRKIRIKWRRRDDE